MLSDIRCPVVRADRTCYWKEMWRKLNYMRGMSHLCDVTVMSGDGFTLMAHSAVLAASSDTLHRMLMEDCGGGYTGLQAIRGVRTYVGDDRRMESCNKKIFLPDVASDILRVTIDFVYGVTPHSNNDFSRLRQGAQLLGIPGASDYCDRHLQDLSSCQQNAATMRSQLSPGLDTINGSGNQFAAVEGTSPKLPHYWLLKNDVESKTDNCFKLGTSDLFESSICSANHVAGMDLPASMDHLPCQSLSNAVENRFFSTSMSNQGPDAFNDGSDNVGLLSPSPKDLSTSSATIGYEKPVYNNLSTDVLFPQQDRTCSVMSCSQNLSVSTAFEKPTHNNLPIEILSPAQNLTCDVQRAVDLLSLRCHGLTPPSDVVHNMIMSRMSITDLSRPLDCPHLKKLNGEEPYEFEPGITTEEEEEGKEGGAEECLDSIETAEYLEVGDVEQTAREFQPSDPHHVSDSQTKHESLSTFKAEEQAFQFGGQTEQEFLLENRTVSHCSSFERSTVFESAKTSVQNFAPFSSSLNTNSRWSRLGGGRVDCSEGTDALTPSFLLSSTGLKKHTNFGEYSSQQCVSSSPARAADCTVKLAVTLPGDNDNNCLQCISNVTDREGEKANISKQPVVDARLGLLTCTGKPNNVGERDLEYTAHSTDSKLSSSLRTSELKAKIDLKCSDCSAEFPSTSKLHTHQFKVHGKGKLFNCDQCSFKSPRKKDLQAHMLSQHHAILEGVRVFNCNDCSYKCIDKNRFEEHQAMHTGVMNHACPQCGKRYTTRRGMRTHLKYHSAERPHRCEHCSAAFKVRSKLVDHNRLVHLQKGIKPFKCGYCPHVTALRGNCNQHIRKNHAGQPVKVMDLLSGQRKGGKEYDYMKLSTDNMGGTRDLVQSLIPVCII